MPGTNEHLSIDIYKILRLDPGASEDEIKKRFRKLTLEFFPDKIRQRRGTTTATEELRWRDINTANQILTDDCKKREWDNYYSREDKTFECWTTGICDPEGEGRHRGDITRLDPHYFSPISMRWFCSQRHANDYEKEHGYTAETHGYIWGEAPPPPPPPPNNYEKMPRLRSW